MFVRVRLSSDVSEIKLVFSILPHRPTTNFAAGWSGSISIAFLKNAGGGILIAREHRNPSEFICEDARRFRETAMRIMLSSTLVLLIGTGVALAFPTDEVPTAEAAYLAKVKTAAPEQIVAHATIVMMQDGKPKSLQAGTNGFTCMISPDGTPLCADENGMAWNDAVRSKTDPPNKIGFIYMLAGDNGTSNHDPYQRASHQHWVQTGPHVMIVGPAVREMVGYPRSADVSDPTQPYVMFPGTPYEHLMLPVTAAK